MTRTSGAAKADAAYIDAGKTLRQAGHLMRELGVAVLRVRGEDGEVEGTISRDMVVRRIAAGGDPKTVTVGEVASALAGRRRAPARAPGRLAGRGHHGPDPGGPWLDWQLPGPAWPWQGRAARENEKGTRRPGLVA